jgi:hypothetical protein
MLKHGLPVGVFLICLCPCGDLPPPVIAQESENYKMTHVASAVGSSESSSLNYTNLITVSQESPSGANSACNHGAWNSLFKGTPRRKPGR